MGRQNTNVFLEDSFGFIWIGADKLYKHDGHSPQPFHPMLNDSTPISIGRVYALLEDAQNRIWVGADNGLFCYDRETNRFKRYLTEGPNFDKGEGKVLSLFSDSLERIWIGDRRNLYVIENPNIDEFKIIKGIDLGVRRQGIRGITSIKENKKGEVFATSNKGLWQITDNYSAELLLPPQWENAINEFQILDADFDDKQILWLATRKGLWLFDSDKRSFSQKKLPIVAEHVVREVLISEMNEVWLGISNNGLFRLKSNGDYEYFSHSTDNPYSLIDNRVKALYLDRFNNLWIGTLFGSNRINFEQQQFPFYQIDPGPFRFNNFTHRILQDSLGGFWFRSLRLGLGYSPSIEGEFETLLHPEASTIGEEIKNFCVDPEGNVWVITLTKGLYLFKKGSKSYRHIELGDSMHVAYTLVIISDRIDKEYLWFTTQFGLCRLNRFTFQKKWFYPKDDLSFVDDNVMGTIDQDDDGNIWCTLKFQGKIRLAYFDKNKEKFIAKPDQANHPSSIIIKDGRHIKSVPGNKIWFGHTEGLMIVDASNMTFNQLTKGNGLPVDTVQNIIPDQEGNIWLTGMRKICRYDGKAFECIEANGDIERFNNWCATIGKDGRITFGGRNGIYSFYPNEIDFKVGMAPPTVYLSNFKVFNKERKLNKAYEIVKEISLDYVENVFSIAFAAPYFLRSEHLRYKHKLEPFEDDWVETASNERQATYTNLSPGNYTFKVVAANSEGIWTPEEEALLLKIIVLPPWYQTWWAYLLWVLLIAGSMYTIYEFQLSRRLVKEEALQLKELDEVKTRLYTNITHEFRTPLTVILGMAHQVVNDPKDWLVEGTRMIRRNGQRLLQLVNQMLDLSKLEAGAMPLYMIRGDIVQYLRYINESFHSFAELRGVSLHFLPSMQSYHMDFDPEKLIDIISNLISNAIKYTNEGGNVYLQLQEITRNGQPHIEFKVKDTGIGMKEEDVKQIFDRFYQMDQSDTRRTEGTGIGLALTKELVNLLGGNIEVTSQVGIGSTFTVSLPITHKAEKRNPLEENWSLKKILLPADKVGFDTSKQIPPEELDLPLLLIIEDNQDVVQYLVSCLSKEYQLLTAANGQIGIDKAIECIPDIIISDVMMPERDGYEVCRILKQDERTNHIPIILLTAKADLPSKLKGLEGGADAYLAKPFNEAELNIRLKKLIELRQTLQQQYINFKDTKAQKDSLPSPEDVFMTKVREIIESNMSNPDFGIMHLGRELGLSRSQLFRKMKALTGKSTSLYIRSIRLQKARELILHTELNVSEIAYDVGFSSPAFFTRAFSEEFGKAPSYMR